MSHAGIGRSAARWRTALRAEAARVRARFEAARFETKLALLYGALFAGTIVIAAMVLAPVLWTLSLAHARANVEGAGAVFDRLWELRTAEMQRAADVAARDFGLRSALATDDPPTVFSALGNMQQRLRADRVLFVPFDGPAVEAVPPYAMGEGRRLPGAAAAALVQALESSPWTTGGLDIEGERYLAAVSIVRSPQPQGWLVVADHLEQGMLADTAPLLGLPIRLSVTDAEAGEAHEGPPAITQRRPLRMIAGPGGARAELSISYPVVDALAPSWPSLIAVVLVGAAGAIGFGLGCRRLARALTRPIVGLTGSARALRRGAFVAAPADGSDEVAELARAFNDMAVQIRLREEALRKQYEEQSRLREEAQQASRAKSDFLASMSHELRTPLNAIIGYSELLSDVAREDGRGQDLADHERVLAAARHLLALIEDILDHSKIEAGQFLIHPAPFDASALVAEVERLVAPQMAAQGNRHRVLGAERLGLAVTDEKRLKQCLLNLLSNAAKFTHAGEVTIEARRVRETGGDWLVSRVRDTGIGMSAQAAAALFAPFVQADASITRRFGGTGLGLAITRRLARLLGGDVELVSTEEGAGSEFLLRVPARFEGHAANDGAAARPARSA